MTYETDEIKESEKEKKAKASNGKFHEYGGQIAPYFYFNNYT